MPVVIFAISISHNLRDIYNEILHGLDIDLDLYNEPMGNVNLSIEIPMPIRDLLYRGNSKNCSICRYLEDVRIQNCMTLTLTFRVGQERL